MENRENLKNHIILLSESDKYESAKREWVLFDVQLSDAPGGETCPCGKTHIKELCYIRNKHNGTEIFVGNTCIKQFMHNIDTILNVDKDDLFKGIRKMRSNPDSANPNMAVIDYAWNSGFLYGENEYDFLVNICGGRGLSDKQITWRRKIVRRILNRIVVHPEQRERHLVATTPPQQAADSDDFIF